MEVKAAFTAPFTSSTVTSVPLFIPSINPLRGTTASKNRAWILESCSTTKTNICSYVYISPVVYMSTDVYV